MNSISTGNPSIMSRVHVLVTVLVLSLSALAQTDRVTRQDGRDAHGAVTGVWLEGVVLTTADGEELIPWSHVAYLTSANPIAVDFGGGNRAVGLVVAYEPGSRIAVETDVLGILRIPLDTLAPRPAPEPAAAEEAAAEGPKTPLDPHDWTGGAALFTSVTRGNAEVFDLSLELQAAKQWTHDRIELNAFAVRGVAEGETNKDAQRARGLWRHFYSDDFYSYASLEIGRDSIQEVSLRLLANIGAGYVVWKESDDEMFAVEGGIGYRHESFEGDDEGRNDATGRVALIYKDIFFERGKYDQIVEVIVPFNEPGALLGRFEAGFTLPIAESWNLRNSLRLSYRGDTPDDTKALDVYFGVGLEYTF